MSGSGHGRRPKQPRRALGSGEMGHQLRVPEPQPPCSPVGGGFWGEAGVSTWHRTFQGRPRHGPSVPVMSRLWKERLRVQQPVHQGETQLSTPQAFQQRGQSDEGATHPEARNAAPATASEPERGTTCPGPLALRTDPGLLLAAAGPASAETSLQVPRGSETPDT